MSFVRIVHGVWLARSLYFHVSSTTLHCHIVVSCRLLLSRGAIESTWGSKLRPPVTEDVVVPFPGCKHLPNYRRAKGKFTHHTGLAEVCYPELDGLRQWPRGDGDEMSLGLEQRTRCEMEQEPYPTSSGSEVWGAARTQPGDRTVTPCTTVGVCTEPFPLWRCPSY